MSEAEWLDEAAIAVAIMGHSVLDVGIGTPHFVRFDLDRGVYVREKETTVGRLFINVFNTFDITDTGGTTRTIDVRNDPEGAGVVAGRLGKRIVFAAIDHDALALTFDDDWSVRIPPAYGSGFEAWEVSAPTFTAVCPMDDGQGIGFVPRRDLRP